MVIWARQDMEYGNPFLHVHRSIVLVSAACSNPFPQAAWVSIPEGQLRLSPDPSSERALGSAEVARRAFGWRGTGRRASLFYAGCFVDAAKLQVDLEIVIINNQSLSIYPKR
jgi:hypothetical protein